MHPQLQRLVELQAVDLRLHEIRERQSRFPKRLAEVEARVSAARQHVAASKEALTSSVKDRRKYEVDVEQWKERAKKYRDQSFEVKTNEAFKALQSEIQHAEDEVARAEDRLLERMVAGEEYERQVKSAEAALKQIEAAAETDRRAIQAEHQAVQNELATAEAARAQAVNGLSEDLFDHYQRIAKRHHGVALAEVSGEGCGQCGVHIRPHVIQQLQRAGNEEIFHCETCTRILYYADHTATAAASTADTPVAPAHEN